MKKRVVKEIKSTKEKTLINTIAICLSVCILSLLVGGIVVLYNNLGKDKKESKIVSYEDGNAMISIINKLDTLDLFKKNYKDLNDEEFLYLVASMTEKDENGNYKVYDLNKTAKEYFNREIKIVKFICRDCGQELFVFDEASNSYIPNPEHGAHGAAFDTRDVYNIYFSSKKDSNLYYVTVLKAFSNSAQTGCGASAYYDSLSESNKVIDVIYDMETCTLKTDIAKEITNNKAKLNKYTYTFEKIDDKFILKSIEAE